MIVVVLGLSLGCGTEVPQVSPPSSTPPSPDRLDESALGRDARCIPTTGGDFAHRAYIAPLSLADAEFILVCTTWFEIGMMPPKRQGQAFSLLFEQHDAMRRFQAVADLGGPAGRLYALAAFDILDKSEADRVGSELARDGRRVLFKDSDVMFGPRLASELVDLVRRRRIGDEFRRDRAVITAHYNKAR